MQSRRLWQQGIHRSVESINIEPEQQRGKDERKKLRKQRQVDAEEGLCVHPGCVVMAVSEQGRFNKP